MLCTSYFNRSFHISFHFNYTMLTSFMGAFPTAQQVKNPPVMQETHKMRVRSLGQEDPLEEEMATHSSILAWRIPWTEEPGGLQSIGLQRVRHNEHSCTHLSSDNTEHGLTRNYILNPQCMQRPGQWSM